MATIIEAEPPVTLLDTLEDHRRALRLWVSRIGPVDDRLRFLALCSHMLRTGNLGTACCGVKAENHGCTAAGVVDSGDRHGMGQRVVSRRDAQTPCAVPLWRRMFSSSPTASAGDTDDECSSSGSSSSTSTSTSLSPSPSPSPFTSEAHLASPHPRGGGLGTSTSTIHGMLKLVQGNNPVSTPIRQWTATVKSLVDALASRDRSRFVRRAAIDVETERMKAARGPNAGRWGTAMPQDVLVRIMAAVGPDDAARCSHVCKDWLAAYEDDRTWCGLHNWRWCARDDEDCARRIEAAALRMPGARTWRERYVRTAMAIGKFNIEAGARDPARALAPLREAGILAADADPTPQAVAEVLLDYAGLGHTSVGKFIARRDPFFAAVRDVVIRARVRFVGTVEPLDALRAMLAAIQLPKESNQIAVMLRSLSRIYFAGHCPAGFAESAESAYVFFNAMLMINTVMHNSAIKESDKVPLDTLVSSMRGLNEGRDFDRAAIERMYNDIRASEFRFAAGTFSRPVRDARATGALAQMTLNQARQQALAAASDNMV